MEEIEEPTGKFILDNLPFEKRFQTANGLYIHYADVCTLLKKYHKSKVEKLNKPCVMRSLLANYEGNWTEDFSHENGNYMNMCIRCDQEFLGHKRRVICKKCFSNGA